MAESNKTSKSSSEKDFPIMLLQLKRIADALEKNNTLNEKQLKMQHVSFVKEQRERKAGTDYKSYKKGNNGQAKTIED